MTYTIIYTDHTLYGSHWQTTVSQQVVETLHEESFEETLDRYEIDPSAVSFAYEGKCVQAMTWGEVSSE